MIFYNILVNGELQTTCRSLDKAQHIIDIYKESNTFPNSVIEIVQDPIEQRAEDDLLSQFLNTSEFASI